MTVTTTTQADRAPCASTVQLRHRARPRDRSLFRRLSVVVSTLAIAVIVMSCNDNDLNTHLVIGTERIEPGGNSPWFTISPDERWIAFMEVDSVDWDPPGLREHPERFHLVTLNLATLGKTHHSLNGLSKEILSRFEFPPWEDLQLSFEERSWAEDQLHMRIGGGIPPRPWIAFTPGMAMAERVEPPRDLSCCACPPPRDYAGVLKNRGLGGRLGYGAGTAAYRHATFSKTIYASPIGDENGGIDRVSEDGSVERIFAESRTLRRVEVDVLLISPDEQLLAFRLTTEVRSPVPLPTIRDELHVLNLATGEHRRVGGSYRLMGNMMWSEDSKRLYYAAVNGETADGKGDGVFVIEFSQ